MTNFNAPIVRAAAEQLWVCMLENIIKIDKMNQAGWWFNDKITWMISFDTFCVQCFWKYNRSCYFNTMILLRSRVEAPSVWLYTPGSDKSLQ